jgi:hypothetical protein
MDDDLRLRDPMGNPLVQAALVLGTGAALMGTVALSGFIGMAALVGQARRIRTPICHSQIQ